MVKNGFELVRECQLDEIGGIGRLWKDLKSGAELLSVCNKDENKCFGVSFFTPPTDSTGVAHILEHSVLCGSAKYPLKEPFAELLKGSLQTFLNAFTFPDKTCYPVASANLQDFYNLIEVYLDAVFHPLLTRNTFSQEGWHVDAKTADGPWSFKGVVYNEMKGVYSSPESILAERSQQAVFPDNIYCLDSGGNPECIPNLTYLAFKDFHNRYYQPGNARFFFWGDDPEDKRLEIIASAIAGAGPVASMPTVALQAFPAENRYIEVPYNAADDETRAMFTCNWLLPERGNVAAAMKLEMLEHILEGLPGSPLRRALMESGLGEDCIGCGLETDLRQMYYSIGLKGIAEAEVGKAEKLILDALKKLAEDGIDQESIAAAVNSVEFSYREDNAGRFPRGLVAMLQSLSTWLYGGDPFAPLAWEKPLADIKTSIAKGEKLFEQAIKTWFLQKPYARVTLLPDKKLGGARSQAETARLNEIQAQTGPAGREQLAAATAVLEEAQLKPDSPADLAKIPALGIKDLPRTNKNIEERLTKEGSMTFLSYDLPTRGVAYLALLLPLNQAPAKLLPLLPLFARSLTECGSAKRDYAKLGTALAANTGGIGAAMLLGAKLASSQPFCYLNISGKTVYDKQSEFFDLLHEILLEPQNNSEILKTRLQMMALETKARLEQTLQMGGHAAISMRLAAHFSGEGALAELFSGFSQLQHIRGLIERLNSNPEEILADLEDLRKILISSSGAIVAIAAENKALESLVKDAGQLLANLPTAPAVELGAMINSYQPMTDLPAAEAILTPGQVNYVGKAANLYQLGYEYAGSINVIMRWLRMGKLWEEVRVAGGAYGAFCAFDRISGVMSCASYRDPNVNRTLSAYDGLGQYLRNFDISKTQLEQAIVGAVGAMDTYLLPDARAAQAMAWHLAGITPEIRQQTREQMLATTAADFHNLADALAGFAESGAICVMGGDKTAQAAKEHGWSLEHLF